jgi:hypothetical protein
MMASAVTASRRAAVAEMTKPSVDLPGTLARLSAATIFELRGEWRRLHRMPPPMRLSRDLLMRGITYKLQERPLGGLSNSILRKLEGLNVDSKVSALSMRTDSSGTAGAIGPSQSSPVRLPGPIGRVRVSSV